MANPKPNQSGLRRGNRDSGTRPAEEKTSTYRKWLSERLKAKKHRAAFVKAIEDDKHQHFMRATQHAAAYSEGLPVQNVTTESQVTVYLEGGIGDLTKPDE